MQVAHINYLRADEIPEVDRVSDDDNIIRIHGINSPTIRQHHDLYRQLLYGRGPLTRIQREMIAVVVSAANECHY